MFDPCFHKMQPQSCFSGLDLGKGFLGNFISLVGPGDQQLICFYAPVQFSHKVNQKSHVALKNATFRQKGLVPEKDTRVP